MQLRRPLEAVTETVRRFALEPAYIALVLICIGLILRIANFASNASLWLDEALLALNLRNRDFSGVLGTLDFHQTAPPLHLIAHKASVLVLGDSEYALRAFPLMAGIAALALFPAVARHFLDRWAAVLALGLFVVLGPLIAISGQVKHYSTDVAVAILLLYAISRFPASRPLRLHEAVAFGCVGAVAPWLSYPAIFYLAGFGVVVVGAIIARRRWRSLPTLVIPAALWTASVVLLLFYALDRVRAVQTSLRGDPNAYAPLASSGSDLRWFVDAPEQLLRESAGLAYVPVATALALVGLASLLRRDPERGLLLASPLLFAVVASALDKYPFGGRFSFFYVPVLVCLVAGGVDAIAKVAGLFVRRFGGPRLTAATAVVTGLALVAVIGHTSARSAARNLVAPSGREEIKPLLERMQREWKRGDAVYVYFAAQYAFRYYAECNDCGVADRTGATRELWARVRPTEGREGWARAVASRPPKLVVATESSNHVAELNGLRGEERVWALFSHVGGRHQAIVAAVVARLDALGRRVSKRETKGAVLYLYDLGSR